MKIIKIQNIFKVCIASLLGSLNLAAFFTISAFTEKSLACSAIAKAIPKQLEESVRVDATGIIESVLNFILFILESFINLFTSLFHSFSIHLPVIDLPTWTLDSHLSPIQIFPYFQDPNHILTLCNYANILPGIAVAVAVTGLLSFITTALVTSNIPKSFSIFVNRRRAEKAIKQVEELTRNLESIEDDCLEDCDLIRKIRNYKQCFDRRYN